MNVVGSVYEWLAAPIILFTHTDRFLFLINWVSFLMLPGLIFIVLKHSGGRLQVAWWWSWLLASGWCYITQSASISNDGFGSVYALAAVALALKSRETGNMMDLWLSFLAVALLTGVKASNLPLALLWMVAAAPQFRNALKRPVTLCVVILLSALVSAIPNIFFNLKYTETWSGLATLVVDNPGWHVELDSPFWGVIGNVFCLPVQNLLPPFFPLSGAWNHAMDAFVKTHFGSHFESFERFGALSPGVSESTAGIGLGIVLMILVSVIFAWKYRRNASPPKVSMLQWALRLVPWLLLLVFMAKDGERQNARHLSPYYVFFFPVLLSGIGHQTLVRKVWWKKMALVCMGLAAFVLTVSTMRPLFPACTILDKLASAYPQSRTFTLLLSAYSAPRSLEDCKRQIEAKLPANQPVIGYAAIGNAESEPLLWLPLGSRKVERVLQQDRPEELAKRGIHCVVIHQYPSRECTNIDDWMARYHATMVAELPFQTEVSLDHLDHIYIMQLN